MAKVDTKNFYVAHYHEDEQHINDLKTLMGDTYQIKNYSVTSDKFNNAHNEDYIKSLLRPLIFKAGTFVCLIGENTHDSKWVDWEIREAARQGKPIIGVFCLGAKDSDIPEALAELADSIVGWRKDKIEAAVEGKLSFENADGSPRSDVTVARGQC